MSRQEFANRFSTLFTARIPKMPAGSNPSVKPIQMLLREAAGELPEQVDGGMMFLKTPGPGENTFAAYDVPPLPWTNSGSDQ